MTTYAILHRSDPERCIRFFRQYGDGWHEEYEWAIRGFFKRTSQIIIEDHPYCKIDNNLGVPCVATGLDEGDTFIDFENNPRRRAI